LVEQSLTNVRDTAQYSARASRVSVIKCEMRPSIMHLVEMSDLSNEKDVKFDNHGYTTTSQNVGT